MEDDKQTSFDEPNLVESMVSQHYGTIFGLVKETNKHKDVKQQVKKIRAAKS